MQATSDIKYWFTYEEAAKELDRSRSSVARAASQGILHPKSLPGARVKYIHLDEIEWFRDKTLTRANAILYRDMKRQQIPQPSEKEAFFTEENIVGRLIMDALRYALSAQDDKRKRLARQKAFNLIETLRQTEEGQAEFGSLATMLAGMLASRQLSHTDRVLLRECLDVLLDMGAGEQEPPSYGRLVADTEDLDNYKASRTQHRSQAV